ncbi:MAG: preprotein translocase subunit SecA [Candidatus Cloacimonadota bacterium]|nr:MAG: preprotein translocase subunit SecA [Candidatus Cloacimonadota bacterium]
MFAKLINKLFGDRYSRALKQVQPVVDEIASVYRTLEKLSDEQIRERVREIKKDLQQQFVEYEKEIEETNKKFSLEVDEKKRDEIGIKLDKLRQKYKEESQKALDAYLPEVFALVKDTCRRLQGCEYTVRGNAETWFMIPFDVQLIGGIALHRGNIAEMATGEGKTLVAVAPLFLNALLGRGVHLVTVNDYLAQRDSEWMSPIFEFHGMEVGVIIEGMTPVQRKEEYAKDVTYGTNSQFGFDYLRDNMATDIEHVVQRPHYFAIVDEVDSVLIDEARTPLIISGPVAESKNYYKELLPHIHKLVNAQTAYVNRLVSEIKSATATDSYNPEEIGEKLLLAKRGTPKNKQLIKLLKDPALKKLMNDTEGYFLRDKKMHELDESLFFVIEEQNNSSELTEKGRDLIGRYDSNLFIMEQLDDQLAAADNNDEMSLQDKMQLKNQITEDFFEKNEKLHNISQLLKAYALFDKDVDYVVQDNKVMIVDEFTGRLMPGRRFSDGLHQALEAKENVRIERASQTLATITLQNYFRMYDKLAGMTGTAITEEGEFIEIYNLPVQVIPTNVPITRQDHEDVILMTKNAKYKMIIEEIEYWHNKNKPVLVGTVTVEVSEILSRMLSRKKIKHNVLNAKKHESEAEIVKFAGQPGSVTIATNMAGRGTDIKLGEGVITREKSSYQKDSTKVTEENPYGLPLDGLHVIGTERHESRRIDRQLRGRAGRQGDPGTSRFYLSLEDDLMRLFGSDRIAPMIQKLGFKEDDVITHPWMTSSVERAQKRVETHNFEIRKQLIKYDEVMNNQREMIYSYRRNVLKGYDLREEIIEMICEASAVIVESYIANDVYEENWQIDKIINHIQTNMSVLIREEDIITDNMTQNDLIKNVENFLLKAYERRENELGLEVQRDIERRVLLAVVDDQWRDHLREMDLLKEGIGLRAYGQKDPLMEYKKESFKLFQALTSRIYEQVAKRVFTTFIIPQGMSREEVEMMLNRAQLNHSEVSAFGRETQNKPPEQYEPEQKITPRRAGEKIGPNQPCPCGSGKKFKKCCGKPGVVNEQFS